MKVPIHVTYLPSYIVTSMSLVSGLLLYTIILAVIYTESNFVFCIARPIERDLGMRLV